MFLLNFRLFFTSASISDTGIENILIVVLLLKIFAVDINAKSEQNAVK